MSDDKFIRLIAELEGGDAAHSTQRLRDVEAELNPEQYRKAEQIVSNLTHWND